MTPVSSGFAHFDLHAVPSPCYVIDLDRLEANAALAAETARAAGAKALLALKAFATVGAAPAVGPHLDGVCASGLYEARLGRRWFGGEVHTHGAAFPPADLEEIFALSDHLAFNSPSQLARARALIEKSPSAPSIGLRLNPEQREVGAAIYDPSAPRSRLGTTRAALDRAGASEVLARIEGAHVHNLCGHGLEPLTRTVAALETGFPDVLERVSWLNLGGGHHLTAPDYDRAGLVALLERIARRWGVELYLEPGEAIALGAGILVTEVLDVVWNDGPVAILDASPTAHVPDAIEMPYRVDILGEVEGGPHRYALGGLTCLAGDRFGEYAFAEPLGPGDRLAIDDAAYYTMVKTTTFNGVALPSIATWRPSTDELRLIARFGYDDFERRLGGERSP